MKRLGRADIGVSISLRLLLGKPLTDGGGGRANGFGGPVAPALSSVLALGDGGGSTTPLWPCSRFGVSAVPAGFGDVAAVCLAASSSSCSLGISTLSRGRFVCRLLLRLGAFAGMLGRTGVEAVL